MRTSVAAKLVCAAGFWIAVAGCALARRESKAGESAEAIPGLEYRFEARTDPRPNRIHILRADLGAGELRIAAAIAADPDGDGPAEAALTDPRRLAAERQAIAYVNANPWDSLPDAEGRKNRAWFEGQPVDILGLAASGGLMRSPARPGGASVWIDMQGRLGLSGEPGRKTVAEGVAGFQPIVAEGAVVVPPGGPMHPRTAVGADRAGRVVWLAVVDGRQEGFSEGMTLHELGAVMAELGCWNATNLDGGGSSVMGLAGKDGELQIVNSPSDRILGKPKIRPVPVILAIVPSPMRIQSDAGENASMN